MEAASSNSAMLSPLKSEALRYSPARIEIKANIALRQAWHAAFGELKDWRDSIVESELQTIATVVDEIFRTQTKNLYLPESDLLPRSLFINPIDETVYIFSKHHSTANEGGNKKVCDAIKIQCFQNNPKQAFHFKRLCKKKKDRFFSEREIDLETRFSQIHELLSYPRKDGVMKTVLIQDAFHGDLESLMDELSSEERLEVFSQILQQLKKMFTDGFLHADIKTKNVLIQRLPNGSVQARLTDYEFAYNPQLIKYPKAALLDRCYATKKYSAPEHFITGIAKLDDRFLQGQAEDLFALGVLFIQLFSKNDTFETTEYAWSQKWYDNFVAVTEEIDEPELYKIATIGKGLLHPNPLNRMTIHSLLTAIEDLKIFLSAV